MDRKKPNTHERNLRSWKGQSDEDGGEAVPRSSSVPRGSSEEVAATSPRNSEELRGTRGTFLRALIAVSIVSLLLAAPVLLPFVEILPHSMSYRVQQEAQLDRGTAFSDFPMLALLVHPRLYGQRPGALWGWAVTESVAGFCGLLGFGACLAMLVRAVIGRRFREREFFFVLATLLTFAVIDDTPYISAPVRELFSIALNSRFRLQFSFMLAVQTAALLHYAKRERWLVPVAIGGSLAALAFVLVRTGYGRADELKPREGISADAVVDNLAAAAAWILAP